MQLLYLLWELACLVWIAAHLPNFSVVCFFQLLHIPQVVHVLVELSADQVLGASFSRCQINNRLLQLKLQTAQHRWIRSIHLQVLGPASLAGITPLCPHNRL
jgi:hypothetical protein